MKIETLQKKIEHCKEQKVYYQELIESARNELTQLAKDGNQERYYEVNNHKNLMVEGYLKECKRIEKYQVAIQCKKELKNLGVKIQA